MWRTRKCQGTNEQAHRESDSAQQCYAIQLKPATSLWQFRQTKANGQSRQTKDAQLFAQQQAQSDSERYRIDQVSC